MKYKTTVIGLLTAGTLTIAGAEIANAGKLKVSLESVHTQAQLEQALN